jgi:hypothetical protein
MAASPGIRILLFWDLEVLWAEREAYVSTILQGGDPEAAPNPRASA